MYVAKWTHAEGTPFANGRSGVIELVFRYCATASIVDPVIKKLTVYRSTTSGSRADD